MRRTLTLTSAALLIALAGCTSSTSTASDTTTPTAAPATSPAAPAKPSKTPEPAQTTCGPERDVIVRYKVPELQDSAQVLGNYNAATCEPTFAWLQHSSPTETGYCTQAAWASDNPGYNADATPAKKLKKVQMSVGPGC